MVLCLLKKHWLDSIIILRFGETKEEKEELYDAKKPMQLLNIDILII